MSRLAVLRDPQSELLLLRACAGINNLVNLLRCQRSVPEIVDRGVAIFDEPFIKTLHSSTGQKKLVGMGRGWGYLHPQHLFCVGDGAGTIPVQLPAASMG
jgi:hypothetical protein